MSDFEINMTPAERKLVLNSNLGKLLRGDDIEASVDRCVEMLGYFAGVADETARHMRTRRGGRYLRERLEFFDLPKLGNYSCERKKKKGRVSIYFQKRDEGIEFHFAKGEVEMADELVEMIQNAKCEEEAIAMTNIMLAQTITGREKTYSETVLGNSSRTLKGYTIDEVYRFKEVVGRGFMGLWAKVDVNRELIYSGNKED